MKNEGTPKTIRQAIKAGIEQYKTSDVQSIVRDSTGDILTAFIMAHVRDFCAQKFGVSYLVDTLRSEATVANEIWHRIFDGETK